jgi:hypothetical protein
MDHPRVEIVNTEGLRRRLLLVVLGSVLVWVTAMVAALALWQWDAIGTLGVFAVAGVVLLALLTVVLWVAARGLACLQTTDGYVFFGLARRPGERFTARQTDDGIEITGLFAGFHATTQGLQFQTSAQAGDSPDTVTTYPWTDVDVVAPRWCTLRVTVRSTQESLSFYTPVAHRVAHLADGLQDGRC